MMVATVAVAVGLIVGISMGALGGGGSILTVPVLVYLLGMDTLAATTGSLIIVGITAVFGVLAHRRDGNVRLLQGLVFGAIGVAGAVAGTRLALQVSPDVLLAGFSVLMLTVAALMFSRRRVPAAGAGSGDDRDAIGVDVPIIRFAPSFACSCPRAAKVVVAAVAVGLMTGFFGVGGGFLVVPALVLVLDFPMPAAVGTSLLIIAINSATALVARAGTGVEIDWAIIGPFTGAAVIGSLLGARVAARARPRTLQMAFAVLITVVGLYTAARSIPGLIA